MADAVLELRGVSKSYRARGGPGRGTPTIAVDDVSLTIRAGESVGVIGDSGAGKSTLAWMAAGLLAPTSGAVLVDGIDVAKGSAGAVRAARRSVGLVFQDALASFNPMRTVEHALALPLDHYVGLTGPKARTAIGEMMERVGLRASQMTRYPHEFSGGQIQRLAIARALVARPPVVILDEPVSALDVSIRAQILNLLRDLRAEYKLAYLLIATDPAVVEHMTDRVVVMYAGRILEASPREPMFVRPRHPYTVSLLSLGDIDGRIEGGGERGLLPGRVAAATDPSLERPRGCPFSGSCPLELPMCRDVRPELVPAGPGQVAACHAYAATGARAAGSVA